MKTFSFIISFDCNFFFIFLKKISSQKHELVNPVNHAIFQNVSFLNPYSEVCHNIFFYCYSTTFFSNTCYNEHTNTHTQVNPS